MADQSKGDPLESTVGKTVASTWRDDRGLTLVFEDGETICIPDQRALSEGVAHIGSRYFHVQEANGVIARLLDMIERYENALRYISQPTMGYQPWGVDSDGDPKPSPQEWARSHAQDGLVRDALVTCIGMASGALDG